MWGYVSDFYLINNFYSFNISGILIYKYIYIWTQVPLYGSYAHKFRRYDDYSHYNII